MILLLKNIYKCTKILQLFAGNLQNIQTFMQLGFKLSNGVTDTLESSKILIYWFKAKGIYTQKVSVDLN